MGTPLPIGLFALKGVMDADGYRAGKSATEKLGRPSRVIDGAR
jgi:hypothetical protein